ncbi:unnamed protein product [marine sediment metagenome]|uniref:Uncharacterized protein n=1 Tax=marine sediment metagenome TaxID=412755 RepID=X1IZF6_9ZZZZ
MALAEFAFHYLIISIIDERYRLVYNIYKNTDINYFMRPTIDFFENQ